MMSTCTIVGVHMVTFRSVRAGKIGFSWTFLAGRQLVFTVLQSYLNLTSNVRKTFVLKVKPSWENPPHSWSICLLLGPLWIPCKMPNCVLCGFPKPVGLHHLAQSGLNPLLTKMFGQDIWVIDQVWGQDVWILAKFFFCVFLTKKEWDQYPAILTEQTWEIFLAGYSR